MSEQINDGGPAFPRGKDYLGNTNDGMSLRDYFATHATEEDLAECLPATVGDCRKFAEKRGFWPTRQWARFEHADRMLAAREGKK